MTIEYQDQNGQANGSGNGQSGGASTANNGPTSAPYNITNHNIDITNPFQQPKARNNEEPTGASQQQPTSQPRVTFEDIVSKKQFGSLSKDLFDKVSEGDVDSFNDGIQAMMRSVYKTAIEDSNRLMDARLAKFEDELNNRLATSKEADNMLSELKTAIPYAKDPAVEPVARQVLSGFIRQGLSKAEAISATNAYFDRLADKVGQKNNPETKNSGIKYGRDSWDELFN